MQYSLVEVAGQKNVTVFHNGEIYVAADSHRNFDRIVEGVRNDDASVLALFDVGLQAAAKFQQLSDRVTVDHGTVYLDGEAVDNALTEQVVRFLDEGVDDWKPLVAFFENVQENPSANSREELYAWLNGHESVTITEDGYIVGYKGCYTNAEGVPVSTHSAPASDKVRVDGVLVTGFVENRDGSVVTMPRNLVDDNQNRHCSKGLHIGTYAYASGFAQTVLEVHVHPRDVVSVTSDSSRQKIRACAYEVVKVVSEKYQQAVVPASQGRIDTRQNHLSQQRYPKGHPKAGQFVPKGALVGV